MVIRGDPSIPPSMGQVLAGAGGSFRSLRIGLVEKVGASEYSFAAELTAFTSPFYLLEEDDSPVPKRPASVTKGCCWGALKRSRSQSQKKVTRSSSGGDGHLGVADGVIQQG